MPIHDEESLEDKALCSAYVAEDEAIRRRKALVEERWLAIRRSWYSNHAGNFRSTDGGIIPGNIPAGRRAIERAAVRVVKMLTPKVKWFEIGDSTAPQQVISNVDAFMWYVLRKKIPSRVIINQLARCTILYGMPVLKTSITITNGQAWPMQRAVDPFSFYMYPETVSTIAEAETIFEDFLFSYDRYMQFAKRGIVREYPREHFTAPDWPYHLVERLSQQGISDPVGNVDTTINYAPYEERKEKLGKALMQTTQGFVQLTEKWVRKNGSLYQCYIAHNCRGGPKIVGFIKSPYDEPLYRTFIHRALPGELYTTTQAEDIAELDNHQNDMINMFKEAVLWEQGIVAFGGAGAANRKDNLKMKGREKIDLGSESPRDAMAMFSPQNTSVNILRAWQVFMGMINTLGGAGTIAEGQPGRNMPRAGGAVNNLIDLSLSDIQDIAEGLEQAVLTPGLGDIQKVCKLIPDSQLMKIPGASSFIAATKQRTNLISKTDIAGDFEYEWVGSLQFNDERQNAQNMMVFLNMAHLLSPMLEAKGYEFNIAELIQMIWRYTLGQRGLSKVVVPIPQEVLKERKVQQQLQQLMQGGGKGRNGSSRGVAGLNPPAATQGFLN